jgi:hypothetical protein
VRAPAGVRDRRAAVQDRVPVRDRAPVAVWIRVLFPGHMLRLQTRVPVRESTLRFFSFLLYSPFLILHNLLRL